MGKLETHVEELELVNGSLAGAWVAQSQSWERAANQQQRSFGMSSMVGHHLDH